MASGDIIIRWVSESSAAIRDMNRVNTALGRSASKADRWGRRVNTAGNVAMAGLALAVPVAWQMATAASAQEQAIGALNSVFKDYSDVMRAAADDANDLGLSTTEYAEFATVLGAQLQNLGYDVEDSAGLTQDLVDTAADMAAQFGGSTADAVSALSSLLRGERDPIERYAVSLSDASVEAYAAANGMTEAEATVALLNKQLKNTDTIGAAKREYKTFAAQVGRLQGAWADFTAAIGGGATDDSVSIIEQLTAALRGVTRWVKNNPDTFDKIAKGVLGFAAALVTLKAALAVIGTLRTFIRLVKQVRGLPFVEIGLAVMTLKDQVDEFDLSVRGVLAGIKDLLTLDEGEIENWWVNDWIDKLTPKLQTAWEWLNKISTAIDNLLGFRANKLFPSLNIPGIGGRGLIPSAPAVRSSQVGRITTPGTSANVNVYVAGQRQRARVAVEPQWAPSLSLGMI